MTSVLFSLKDRVLNEYQQNPRLKWLCLLVLAICLFYWGLVIKEDVEAKQGTLARTQQRLLTLQQLQTADFWQRRAADADNLLGHLRSQFWSANTDGEAEAIVLGWLNVTFSNIKQAPPAFNLSTLATEINGRQGRIVRASLRLKAPAAKVMLLLGNISLEGRLIKVQQIDVRHDATTMTLDFVFLQ